MKKIIIKSILTTSLFLIFILIFAYNFIYSPLYSALEATLLNNFVNLTETSKVSFEYIIERGIENSKSISSRTMIKNKIMDYKDGLISLDELKIFTKTKYKDGIDALENVVYSARIVDNQVIASNGDKPENINKFENKNKLSYKLIENKETIYLVVYSPIELSDIILGTDIIIFDLSNSIKEIVVKDISINIINKDEIEKYKDEMTLNPVISQHKGLDGLVYLDVFYKIYDDVFLHISTGKNNFFYEFNNITKLSAISMVTVFVFSLIYINIIIIFFVQEKVTSLDISNKKHKANSHYDRLTGAFSRIYLDEWLEKNNEKELNYSIVFIDMNNFKSINDKYGHRKGDEVLRKVLITMKNEIRDNDIIVRFGGDEFIILLENISKDDTIKIMTRINEKLKTSIGLDQKVCFSYGVNKLKNTNEFYDVLEKTDKKMYQMKKDIKDEI